MRRHLLTVVAFSAAAFSAFAEDTYTRSAQEPSARISTPSNSGHYDPAVLNELAVAKIREGDFATGRILLERAALLAPYDARIRRNLYESRIDSGESPSAVAERTGASEQTAPLPAGDSQPMPPAPPPVWPRH